MAVPQIPRHKLGSQGLEVSALGLGCSGLTGAYGTYASEEDAISLFQHAFNRGVTFFDTADVYSKFANEILVGKALKHLPRERVQLATKFGRLFKEDNTLVTNGSAAYVRKACESSLARLGVDYIDLYLQHRVDTQVPIEETVGELKKLVEEGKIKYIGLCEASVDTIRRAHAVHPITALQCEWSLWSRDIEEEIIPTCRELGIGLVSYSPLGRGFFSGTALVERKQNTRLSSNPRFTPENLEKNKVYFERVSNLAKAHGFTAGQLALAWVLHQGDDVVPIPGTTKIKNLDENICALSIKLSNKDMQEIMEAVPPEDVAGLRYAEHLYQVTWKFTNTPPYRV